MKESENRLLPFEREQLCVCLDFIEKLKLSIKLMQSGFRNDNVGAWRHAPTDALRIYPYYLYKSVKIDHLFQRICMQ